MGIYKYIRIAYVAIRGIRRKRARVSRDDASSARYGQSKTESGLLPIGSASWPALQGPGDAIGRSVG